MEKFPALQIQYHFRGSKHTMKLSELINRHNELNKRYYKAEAWFENDYETAPENVKKYAETQIKSIVKELGLIAEKFHFLYLFDDLKKINFESEIDESMFKNLIK